MLNWLRDLDLRRRTQTCLNKGEARNTLARAIFFCQLGKLRDRTFENQAYRASGLNLIVAAVILWNTRYLELAAATSVSARIRCGTSRRSGWSTAHRQLRLGGGGRSNHAKMYGSVFPAMSWVGLALGVLVITQGSA